MVGPCTALALLGFVGLTGCGDDGNPSSGGSGGSSNATGGTGQGGTGQGTGGNAQGTGGNGSDMCANGPLAEPIPNCAPTPLASTGDLHQDCVDRINQFRHDCQCLPPLARWTDGEACTDSQSADDQTANAPHGNFGSCGEFAQNTCPNWGSESDVVNNCLQAMWDEGPGPFDQHGHYVNMSNTDYSKVACGFSSSGQGVWSNQNFAP
ncbi:MAG: hypothetical protein U0271_36340 [Polyangiaceae bacterium]